MEKLEDLKTHLQAATATMKSIDFPKIGIEYGIPS